LNNLLSFLKNIFNDSSYHENTKELEVFCPFCSHHKRKLSINVATQRWQCWVCGKNGKKLLYVVKAAGTPSDVREYLEKYKPKSLKTSIKAEDSFSIELPKEFVPLVNCKNSFFGKKIYQYLRLRGISDKDILRYKIGTAMSGDYMGRIIFPSYDKDGNLNIFTSRALSGGYMNPKLPRNYKNEIIINELNIDWEKPLTIVEGFVDMLKANRNTTPLFGSSLSMDSMLFEKIILNNATVFLALDPDAKKKTYAIAKELMKYGVEVFQVSVDGFEDVGDMSKENFAIAYQNAIVLSGNQIIREKLRNL